MQERRKTPGISSARQQKRAMTYMHYLSHGGGDLRGSDDGRHRESVSDALRHRYNVRNDPVTLQYRYRSIQTTLIKERLDQVR
jgi:hypothetical protein